MAPTEKALTCDADLLAYRGRPALYYPAVPVAKEVRDAQEHWRLASGLGAAKVLCGVLLIVLGGVAVYVDAMPTWVYGGIWSGGFVLVTGAACLVAARQPRRWGLLVNVLLLAILGFFNTGLLAIFSALRLVDDEYRDDAPLAPLVRRRVEHVSTFAVQAMLLVTATADCLLSLSCCVVMSRRLCCGHPVRGHPLPRTLLPWSGHQTLPSKMPKVHTLRQPPHPQPHDGSTPTSSPSKAPLIKEEPQKEKTVPPLMQISARVEPTVNETYLALDRRLAEEFIDRSLVLRRGLQ